MCGDVMHAISIFSTKVFVHYRHLTQSVPSLLSILQFCNQDPVNIIVGLWWAITLLFSICLIPKIQYKDQKPQSGEKLLVENHESPVGYQVPLLPDFEIDPGMADTGSKCLSLRFELIVGVILAIAGGAGMITLAFTSWDEDFYSELTNSTLGDGRL